MNILLVKESRAGEKRVALVPADVKKIIAQGHKVFVELDAGKEAGFPDNDYQAAGATLRQLKNETLSAYQDFFDDIAFIVRAKRPNRAREILENQAISANTIMIGALDPLEKSSPHITEYQQAKIKIHSLDQLNLPPTDPMNLLTAMSKIAGHLALLDALEKFNKPVKKVVIIGFGAVGRAAFAEAIKQKLPITVVITNQNDQIEITKQNAQAILLDKHADLTLQQTQIKEIILNADIVITSARRANHPAPLLIPLATLKKMKAGSVIIDMAISEGGNVEGSEHDQTLTLGNNILVVNVSGYPKAVPHEASILWSDISLRFIDAIEKGIFV